MINDRNHLKWYFMKYTNVMFLLLWFNKMKKRKGIKALFTYGYFKFWYGPLFILPHLNSGIRKQDAIFTHMTNYKCDL